jgi:hypothetical protein
VLNTENIRKAILVHAEWKTRLQKAIETGTIEVSVEKTRSDNQCQLGQWLYGVEFSAPAEQTEHYRTVKQLHARFHEGASNVVKLVMAGQKDAALKAIGVLGSYSTASSALTNALSKWRASG